MATTYITTHWHALNKAVAEGRTNEVWKEIRDLEKKLREKARADKEAHILANREALKKLEPGDPVKYTGREQYRWQGDKRVPFGFAGANGVVVSKARRTRIGVKWGGNVGTWAMLMDNVAPGHHDEQV